MTLITVLIIPRHQENIFVLLIILFQGILNFAISIVMLHSIHGFHILLICHLS